MGSLQGHASSKIHLPRYGGIILAKEWLEGPAGQGPVPHNVTVGQSKYGKATVHTHCVIKNIKHIQNVILNIFMRMFVMVSMLYKYNYNKIANEPCLLLQSHPQLQYLQINKIPVHVP